MRIAIATDAWHPQINGVVRSLNTVKGELEKEGHSILAIGPGEFKTLPCPTYPEIRLALAPARRLRELIGQFDPQAIHIATEGPLGLAARRYCLKRGLPFTTSLHTRFPEYVHLRAPFIPVSWGYAFLRWFHGPATRTMVAVPSLQKELEGHGLRNMAIWSRGVDLEIFQPRGKEHLPGERPLLIYMGRVAMEKNIEAFLGLDLPGTKYVIGGGPDLETLKARYPEARFPGYKTGIELAEHLSAADVFVFPSRTDTFGLVILEALACGVPVAAYPVQGPVDLIRNGENGFVDDDLGTAVTKCMNVKPQTCQAFAARYSWSACAGQFLGNLAAF